MKTIAAIVICLFIFITACKKNETDPPLVTIYSPLVNDSFYVADSVRLQFNIVDENLSNYKVIISNYYNRKIYFREEGTTDAADFSVDKKVYVDIPADTIALLNVLGIDKNGNTGSGSVVFKVKL